MRLPKIQESEFKHGLRMLDQCLDQDLLKDVDFNLWLDMDLESNHSLMAGLIVGHKIR